MKRLLLILAFLFPLAPAGAMVFFHGGAILAVACTFTGSIMGSCLPSSDTTDQITAPRPNFATFSDSFSFGGSQNILINGADDFSDPNLPGCGAAIRSGAVSCAVTSQLQVCATPGNIASNTHPWSTEYVVSWLPTGSVSYNSRGNGTFYASVPPFSPPSTFGNTTGSYATSPLNYLPVSYMTSVCGTGLGAYFVDAINGQMPNLATAAAGMVSNDTVTVSAQPGGFPFWPTGDNRIGKVAGSTNPPYDLTVSFASGATFGYPSTTKGFLDVENNGTVIDGGTCFWVNPGNNQACISWDAGLDLTVNNFYGETAGMGIFRADIRSGITNLQNDTFANMSCMDGGCAFGHNHSIYFGTVATAGLDTLFADNVADPNVGENGWNLKLRIPNSVITNSFFGAQVNNGSASTHGPIDFPCAGTHSVSNTAIEANQYSYNNAISSQPSSFLVSSGEERASNAATIGSGNLQEGSNCPTSAWIPTSASFTATITGPHTFTTTTNPATFVPLITFNYPFGAALWDLGVSGMLVNGPVPVLSWTGPVGGVYTVQTGQDAGACYNGEGTIPLAHSGATIYDCFVGTGTVTLYATGALMSVTSNTPTTLAVSTPTNPATFGFAVGDNIQDPSNESLLITSITGSGPYTINMSCAHATFLGGGNCITPNSSVNVIPVVSGTYDTSTGAVSLTMASSLSAFSPAITSGSSVSISGLFGTGAVSSLNGTYTATSGTTGTSLNYTAATGLGSITIGGSSGGVQTPGAWPSNLTSIRRLGPSQITASTTGSGCDGTNTLCGIVADPRAEQIYQGEQVFGTGINSGGYSCMTAAQITSIQPVGGSSGSGYLVGDTITLSGGTEESNAVVTVATVSSGHVTSVTMTSGGVYTSFVTTSLDHKTFSQGSTSGSGTGAQFQFPAPALIVGGSGPYTLRLAQPSGAACVTSSVTNQVYQVLIPTNITFDHDIVGWDSQCPFGGPCQIISVSNPGAFTSATFTNNLLWTNKDPGSPTWGSGTNTLSLGGTDDGGNIECASRSDTGTSPLCNVPPFTAATFTGSLTGTSLTANCTGACMTISSGTYNSTSGAVSLIVSAADEIPYGSIVNFTLGGGGVPPNIGDTLTANGVTATVKRVLWYVNSWTTGNAIGQLVVGPLTGGSTFDCCAATTGTTTSGSTMTIPSQQPDGSGQVSFTLSGLTGTGSFSSLDGNWQATSSTTGTTLTFNGPTGLGSVTITGGSVNPQSGAALCQPGMFVWDNTGLYGVGQQGVTISGTRIVSGTSPNFTVSIPLGGAISTDLPNKTFSCGWGMPSSVFNGTMSSSGVLTINSGLRGSVHIGDYIADNSSTLPSNIQVTSGSGTTWQTNYSGAGVSAETMVSIR